MHAKATAFRLGLARLWLLLGFAVLAGGAAYADIAPPLSVEWTFSGGPHPGNISRLVISDDSVYFTHLGTVRRLDIRTGGEQWDFRPDNGLVNTSPLLWNDLLIVGATDSKLYALDAKTGRQRWERTCASAICPDPAILEDMLMVGAERMVYSIDPRTGTADWVCSLQSAARAGPLIDGSMLYFLAQDGSVQCVDGSQGRFRWSAQIPPGPGTFGPVVGQRRVIIASGNFVYGVARSGSVAWTAEMPAAVGGPPTVADELLYVPCVDGRLYTMYARSGAPRRHVTYKVDSALTAGPLAVGDIVAAGTAEGLIYVFDRDSGRVEWAYRCRAPDQPIDAAIEFGLYAALQSDGGSLYCRTGTGDVYRFTASAADAFGPRFGEFTPEAGSVVVGGGPITVTFAAADDGSGIDAASVEATIDGSPVKVTFDAVTGVGSLRPGMLRDGSHIVKVRGRDYRGNVGSAEWGFLSDASIAAEPEEAQRPQPQGGAGRRGGGGGRRGR